MAASVRPFELTALPSSTPPAGAPILLSIVHEGDGLLNLNYDRPLRLYSGPPPAGFTVFEGIIEKSIGSVNIDEGDTVVYVQAELTLAPTRILYDTEAGAVQALDTEDDAASFDHPIPWP